MIRNTDEDDGDNNKNHHNFPYDDVSCLQVTIPLSEVHKNSMKSAIMKLGRYKLWLLRTGIQTDNKCGPKIFV